MREVILCKYGEIVLKGANKAHFEAVLLRTLRRRAATIGNYKIYYAQSTVYIEPEDEAAEFAIDEMYDCARHVFGFVSISRAAAAPKDMNEIKRIAAEYLPARLAGAKTFRCEAKRSDKKFPLTSPQIAAEVGGAILSQMYHLKVDLHNPDVTVRVEIRDKEAFIHAGSDHGAGGIPVGSGGTGLLLLSGGIDSPVAGHMMAKRGLTLEAVHFESFPYTSELAREKVVELARLMSAYTGRIRLHIISVTHIQEELRDKCEEDYFTLLLRRFMMALACRTAREFNCRALITGESLGQVASQTLQAINVTDAMADIPVFRPCIGLDKEEIVQRARAIGTFDTSILPYEDCCTVFTPRHPRTKPELEKVKAQEALVDFDALVEEAWQTRTMQVVDYYKN